MKRKQLAPHIHAEHPAAERYLYVMLALLPAFVGAVFYYGIRVLVLTAVAEVTFFFSDYYSARKLYPEQAYYVDYSSLVSGLLLSLMVPVQTSVWAMFLAALFGSLLVKQAFGGVGTNIFNPALASRAFLEWIVPSQMAAVESPFAGTWHLSSLFTGKPLVSAAQTVSDSPWMQIVSGRMAGMVGTTSMVLLGLGLVILMERKLFRFEASLSYILVLIVGYVPCYIHNVDPQSFLLWLSSGGLLLPAIFLLNDCTTTPMASRGKVFFGIGAAILTLLFYRFGNATYAMIFPILMMNMTTPIFDYYIRPQPFSKNSWYREVKS